MKNLLTANKAVSQLIALLLILICISAASFIFYDYATGRFGIMRNTFQIQMEQLLLESANINSTHVTAFIRNIGIADVSVTKAYVDGNLGTLAQNVRIPGESLGAAYVLGTFMEKVVYVVELAFSLGTTLKFSVIY